LYGIVEKAGDAKTIRSSLSLPLYAKQYDTMIQNNNFRFIFHDFYFCRLVIIMVEFPQNHDRHRTVEPDAKDPRTDKKRYAQF
jgi:hypothetical protein